MKVHFALCAILLSQVCHAEMYKWTDENGQVHYSSEAPSASHKKVPVQLHDATRPMPRESKPNTQLGEGRGGDATVLSNDFRIVQKAAQAGDMREQYNLAVMYEKGRGVAKNTDQALFWLTKAAEQGHLPAQKALAQAYDNGSGVKQNWEQAIKWLRKAAEQGDAEAQFSLGLSYTSGRGVKADNAQAYMWLHLAELAGHDAKHAANALSMRDVLAKGMIERGAKPADIEKLKQLAPAWLAQHPALKRKLPSELEKKAMSPEAPFPPSANVPPRQLRAGVTMEQLSQNAKNLRSVPDNGVNTETLHQLYGRIMQSCKSKQMNQLWPLYAVNIREMMILNSSAQNQQQLFDLYCNEFLKANEMLGGKAENGKHSIKQDSSETDNGIKVSYWYIHSRAGELVWRLKVVLENNQLKINDH